MATRNQNQGLSKQARSKVTYLFDLCSIFQRTGSLIFLLCFSALKIALSMSSSQTMRGPVICQPHLWGFRNCVLSEHATVLSGPACQEAERVSWEPSMVARLAKAMESLARGQSHHTV